MDILDIIRDRRSVRDYTGDTVEEEETSSLLEAARWAPSGLNNQPWRFMVVREPAHIEALSEMTRYRGVVAGADALIAVFLSEGDMYDRTKDLLSAGAAVQNILLAAHAMGLGACWLGEILARKDDVSSLLGVPPDHELVALVALGRPTVQERAGVRHPLEKLVLEPPQV